MWASLELFLVLSDILRWYEMISRLHASSELVQLVIDVGATSIVDNFYKKRQIRCFGEGQGHQVFIEG